MIRLEKLHKRYGRFTAVESLDLEVKDGEIALRGGYLEVDVLRAAL